MNILHGIQYNKKCGLTDPQRFAVLGGKLEEVPAEPGWVTSAETVSQVPPNSSVLSPCPGYDFCCILAF